MRLPRTRPPRRGGPLPGSFPFPRPPRPFTPQAEGEGELTSLIGTSHGGGGRPALGLGDLGPDAAGAPRSTGNTLATGSFPCTMPHSEALDGGERARSAAPPSGVPGSRLAGGTTGGAGLGGLHESCGAERAASAGPPPGLGPLEAELPSGRRGPL